MNVLNVNLAEAITKLCEVVEINNLNDKVNIIEGWAEVDVNGIEYQAQIVLEPRKTHYTDEQIVSVRDFDEDEKLIKFDIKK